MSQPTRDLTEALTRQRCDPPRASNRFDRLLRRTLVVLVILEVLTFAWALSQ